MTIKKDWVSHWCYNTCLVEVAMRVSPNAKPTTKKAPKIEILGLQSAKEDATRELHDLNLRRLIICPPFHDEKDTMGKYILGVGNSWRRRPRLSCISRRTSWLIIHLATLRVTLVIPISFGS
ncbi:hypothetical protein M434DRAFT_234620 [Hypoxylon sp. CO27-5]|nr:hypothetical protein M434DRAFT_234620 [Hypoxylon sp. CO27-5]